MWLTFLNFLIFLSCASAIASPLKKFSLQEDHEKLTDPFDGIDYRLPNDTIPLHYDVWLSTDIHIPSFSFDGQVSIRIKAVENSSEITVHHRQLTIVNIDLYDSDNILIENELNFTEKSIQEFLIIKPSSQLIASQEYIVKINYTGTLRDGFAGFYRYNYVDNSGLKKWFATTQFQKTDARHAFPCYDEPQIRATFSIAIRHHSSYRAISNMPVDVCDFEPGTDYVLTKFQEVPPVQTYLIAFTVCDFKYIENNTIVPPQRIYAKPESIENGEADFALQVTPGIVSKLEEYYGINYTLPKMDHIAATDVFGAMENWGAIFYGEPALLYNPLTSTTQDWELIIRVIAHEVSHQWFGNLVSPAWWSYLWLNEGFATLYEYYTPHLVYPKDRWDDSFATDVIQDVFEFDSNPTVRPMTYYVENPDQINALFDRIAYFKAGSVLYMFLNALGDDTWKKGLNYYLTSRAYNSGNSDHLYEGIQRALDEDSPSNSMDIKTIMSSWENQSGFPLVTVKREGDSLTFSQERFLYSSSEPRTTLWWIPINYMVASSQTETSTTYDFWLNNSNVTLQLSDAAKKWTDDDWIIVNIQQKFYYRVNYDENLWNLIFQQLNSDDNGFEKIHLRNRAQLIDDAFHLARADKVDFSVPFRLMSYLSKELDYIPWVAASRASTSLNRWLSGSHIYPQYQNFTRANVALLFNSLGVELRANESRVDRYARTIVINLACQAQLPECLEQTNNELINSIYGNKTIVPEYVSTIYCNGLRTADSTLYAFMKDKMLRSTVQSERNTIITALGCMQSKNELNEFLSLAITDTSLSSDERLRILTAVEDNGEEILETLMEFVERSYRYILVISDIGKVLSNIAQQIGSEKLYERFESFLSELASSDIISISDFEAFKDAARKNLEWQDAYIGPIEAFFNTTTDTFSSSSSKIITSSIVFLLCVFVNLF